MDEQKSLTLTPTTAPLSCRISSKSDVRFPLSTPIRKRHPTLPPLTHAATDDGQDSEVAKHRTYCALQHAEVDDTSSTIDHNRTAIMLPTYSVKHKPKPNEALKLLDLPEEILGRIFDDIFGTLQPIQTAAHSTGLSSRMRHPRRQAVADLALISAGTRILVQERIYRHIKIKATPEDLQEARDWFLENPHLAEHVRHIEYWVPIWGKVLPKSRSTRPHLTSAVQSNSVIGTLATVEGINALQFEKCRNPATLEQIFDHLSTTFPQASIFTLEGGSTQSSFLKHFRANLFSSHLQRRLRTLPQIKVFSMKGAWNIMRSIDDWLTISSALPNVTEWHCRYPKPLTQAYQLLNQVTFSLSPGIRRLEISMDSMFSKEEALPSNPRQPLTSSTHLCEQLGRIVPQLEGLKYTGKICSHFFVAALASVHRSNTATGSAGSRQNTLKHIDLVVKPACRRSVSLPSTPTSEQPMVLPDPLTALQSPEQGGLTNLAFIAAFEHLVLASLPFLAAAPWFSSLKIRYVDLDSGFASPMNPYFCVSGTTVTGIWNERILEEMALHTPNLTYASLEAGLLTSGRSSRLRARARQGGMTSLRHHGSDMSDHRLGDPGDAGDGTDGFLTMLPRQVPKSIHTDTYKVLRDSGVDFGRGLDSHARH